ncbi:MAG: DegV family protein [bacterium]|nr:DegV family protein [bacterium]
MNKVVIFTDSTCDLMPDTIKEFDIKVIPLYVNFKDESFKDGVDMNSTLLYEKVEKTGIMPKTSAATVKDFIDAFTPYIEEGCDIFYTGISSKMSVNMQNVLTASQEFDENRVFVSDSLNLSSDIGLLVLRACKLRDLGKSAKEIKEEIDILAPKVKGGFVIKSMDYLYKGGRCSALSKIFGTILKIKPFIRVKNGSMYVHKKPRGKFHSAIDVMIEEAINDIPNMDTDYIMVTHSKGDEYAPYIIEKLKEKTNIPIMETFAGCVISSHCGKGTIGILYILKENFE